jgi:hypothetical protein
VKGGVKTSLYVSNFFFFFDFSNMLSCSAVQDYKFSFNGLSTAHI